MAIGLGFVFWMMMLFSPLAFVGQANAADSDADNYGTVIGIVSTPSPTFHHKQQLPFVAGSPRLPAHSPSNLKHDDKQPLTMLSGSGNHLLLCRCDAEGQGRDYGQRPRYATPPPLQAPPRPQCKKRGLKLTLPQLPGNRITPSYVAFTDEERLVGDAAKNQAAANPYNTIFDVKYVSFTIPTISRPRRTTIASSAPNCINNCCIILT